MVTEMGSAPFLPVNGAINGAFPFPALFTIIFILMALHICGSPMNLAEMI
jgi:hypothetical protein